MAQDYLKPKTKTPEKIRSKQNGQFVNPPAYMDRWGGLTSAEKLGSTGKNMPLERGPTARGKRPF